MAKYTFMSWDSNGNDKGWANLEVETQDATANDSIASGVKADLLARPGIATVTANRVDTVNTPI